MACNKFLNLSKNIKLPAIGLGTFALQGDTLIKSLEHALKVGYRHIDTAQRYGNEKDIGNVLKTVFANGNINREDVFITSKIPPAYPNDVENYLRTSLNDLRLSYLDLWLIHFPMSFKKEDGVIVPDTNLDYLETWKMYENMVDLGLVKAIGVSNFNIKQLDRLLNNCRIKPSVNQVELHIYMQQRELVKFCKSNNIAVVGFAPLGSKGYNELSAVMGIPHKIVPNVLEDSVVSKIAEKYSKSSAQILLRYYIELGVGAIPRSSNFERIKQNIDLFDFVLSENDMEALKKLEIGPMARIYDFRGYGRLIEHPEYPFEKISM